MAAYIAGLFIFKGSFQGTAWVGPLVSIVNAVGIKIMNFSYGRVALKLTQWENLEFDS